MAAGTIPNTGRRSLARSRLAQDDSLGRQTLLRTDTAASPLVRSVALKVPTCWIAHVAREQVVEHATVAAVGDWGEQLDAAAEVARAEIRRADEVPRIAAVRESVDARVLEEPADDRHDANTVAEIGRRRAAAYRCRARRGRRPRRRATRDRARARRPDRRGR